MRGTQSTTEHKLVQVGSVLADARLHAAHPPTWSTPISADWPDASAGSRCLNSLSRSALKRACSGEKREPLWMSTKLLKRCAKVDPSVSCSHVNINKAVIWQGI
jgi:hypothetical protein